jgi:hypothetical protein
MEKNMDAETANMEWFKSHVEELSFHLASELKDLAKVKQAVRIAYGSMIASLYDDVIREAVDECFMENRYASNPMHDDDYGGG